MCKALLLLFKKFLPFFGCFADDLVFRLRTSDGIGESDQHLLLPLIFEETVVDDGFQHNFRTQPHQGAVR